MPKPLIISIIDDDDIYRYTILRTIESLKISKQNLVYTDGVNALKFISDNRDTHSVLPDIILLDVNMPVMDGFTFMVEYTKLIPKLAKNIIIFMISSSVNVEDVERAQRFPGITDYIVKPIKPTKLQQIIDRLEIKGLI